MSRSQQVTLFVAAALSVAVGCGTVSYVESSYGGLDLLQAAEPEAAPVAAEKPAPQAAGAVEHVETVHRIALPDVVGMTRKEAKKALADAGQWRVYKVRGKAGGYDTGTCAIIAQKPAAGELVEVGTKVFVTFPPAPLRPVPDITGQTANDARKVISKARFSTRKIKKSDRLIIAQIPAAGEMAAMGSAVEVTLE